MASGNDQDEIVELEDDNRRLRRLLERGDVPGELRHRLRSTLALFRAVIGRSARTERDLPGYVAQLEDRLDAIARAQAYADRHGAVDLQSLLADELLQYAASEGERLVLSGPPVRLLARTGQLLALAIHELAVNAVEHGAFGAGRGRLEVSWSVTGSGQDTRLLLSWTETDPKPGGLPVREGFGMDVLTRMLPYDLHAETNIAFGPAGLRCRIRLPIPDQGGQG